MSKNRELTDQELYHLLMNSDDEDDVEADGNNDAFENISSSDEEEQIEDIPGNEEDDLESVFQWQNKDLVPVVFLFDDSESGCKVETLAEELSILECFECIFCAEFVDKIVDQIHLYHDFVTANDLPNKSRLKNWKETNTSEIYVFLAVSLLMSQVKKNRVTDYWSKDALIETPIFSQIMSRDRWINILRMLHFSDNSNVDTNDRLFKVRMVIDYFRNTFKNSLYPFKNIVIDESLMLFKGRISFRQFIPSKRHRFGLKFFVAVDCETGYVLDFILYTGAGTEIVNYDTNLGVSGNIVMTLTEKYWGKGHVLFTDNWYTSPLLYEKLHEKKINACGTVKANRRHMPPLTDKLKRGEIQYYSTQRLLALKWQDKREVRLLSSLHNSSMVTAKRKNNEDIVKPKCVVDYNESMGGVDRTDMLLSTTESVRKSVKWYKKVFFHLLDLAVLNSHCIYKMKTGSLIPLLDFQRQLIKDLIAKYKQVQPRSSGSRTSTGHSPLRLIARHFPSMYPRRPKDNKKISKRCVVCSAQKKRKETCYTCRNCDVALCVVGCFEKYHTVKKF